MIAAANAPAAASARRWTRIDNTIVKAVVRAHRWRNMLESKLYPTVRDLAVAENIDESYLGRVLRLTLLSPKIKEAILSGRQPVNLALRDFLEGFPIEWDAHGSWFAQEKGRK